MKFFFLLLAKGRSRVVGDRSNSLRGENRLPGGKIPPPVDHHEYLPPSVSMNGQEVVLSTSFPKC